MAKTTESTEEAWNKNVKFQELLDMTVNDHEHERKAHMMSRLNNNNHTKKGWRCATESPWTLWHHPPVGPGKDTHGTRVPAGGATQALRDEDGQTTTRRS